MVLLSKASPKELELQQLELDDTLYAAIATSMM